MLNGHSNGNGGLKLTTRGRYAVMAMVELANSGSKRPLPLSDIADKSNISLSYLEQLVAGLRKHGLVRSTRGPGGGYSLGKPASEIIIVDILRAAEDSTPAKRNTNQDEMRCQRCDYTTELWGHIGEILTVTLNGISLDDVLGRQIKTHPTTAKIFEALQ